MTAEYLNSKPDLITIQEETLLLKRVADGDWEAYTQLFNHYLPKLTQYIFPLTRQSKADTEDLIQEIFLLIWEKKEVLIAIRTFDQYLFRMAKNKFIDQVRKQEAVKKMHVSYSQFQATSHSEPEMSLQFTEYNAIAARAIALLSAKLQDVFIMSTQEELSLSEIAKKLELPKETVKKRLYLATRSIKEHLKKHAEWLLLLFWIRF